jgi:hypothetical protein
MNDSDIIVIPPAEPSNRVVLLGVGIGALAGAALAFSFVPPLPLSHLVYQAGTALCKPNEGLREIKPPSRFSDRHTFVCQNTAQFIDVPVTIADPVPAKEPLATREVITKDGS